MKVAGTRRTVPKEGDGDNRVLAADGSHRRTDRLNDLGADRTRRHDEVPVSVAIVIGHLATLQSVGSVAEELVEKFLRCHTPYATPAQVRGKPDRFQSLGSSAQAQAT